MANRVNKDLNVWAPHEELWLWQLAQGLTNVEAAKICKISVRHYGKLVTGKFVEFSGLSSLGLAHYERLMKPPYANVAMSHLLQLARRRYGRGLAGTAALAKVSPPTLHKWEREANPKLIEFWEKRDFTIRHG